MYNHKKRRQIEKDLGLFKAYKGLSESEKAEIRKKKMMAGKQIHLQNTQEVENQRIQREADMEANIMQSLMASGHTEESAAGVIRKNRELAEKRAMKLAAREQRQKKN